MTTTTQVAIIGGGAMGCATAYYLAKAGVRSTVIEREGIATQASGYNAGGLNPLQGAGIPGPLSDIAAATFGMHGDLAQRLEDESGVEYHHKTIAFVTVAFDDSDLPEMQETHDIFDAADGFNAHWLDAAELREMEPRLNPEARRGLYAYGNAILSGYEFTLALARAAERMGAEIRQTGAVGLRTDGDRVTAVILEDGELPSDAVVIASGPWSAQAEQWLNTKIPVEPYKGEILRLRIDGAMPPYDFSGGGANLHIRADGLLWAGATEERKGLRPRAERIRPRHAHERRDQAHALPQRRRDSQAHRLPPSPHTRLAAHSRRGAGLGQRLSRHRRGQERHPARSRNRQRGSRYNHRRTHRSPHRRIRRVPLPVIAAPIA